jgi:hypothetical protein
VARHYQIQHLALSIDDPRGVTEQQSERLLAPFRRPVGWHELAPGRLRLEVHREPSRAVHREPLPRVFQGTVDATHFAVARRGARRRIELPGRATLDFDAERGWAHLGLATADDAAAQAFLLLRLVCDCLARGGHSFVHAACLAMPRGRRWGGVVLSAPSNVGKTTTALALAGSGWRLLGDDVTFVRPPYQGSHLWGLPRVCHVRPGSLKFLPWLSELALESPDAEGVHALPLAQLGDRAWVAAPWLEPTLIVVLDAPNARATRVEAIDRAQALSRLGSESIDAAPDATNEDGARNFVTLGRLACSAPACRLSVGPNPADVAERLEQFVAEDNAAAPRRGVADRRAA